MRAIAGGELNGWSVFRTYPLFYPTPDTGVEGFELLIFYNINHANLVNLTIFPDEFIGSFNISSFQDLKQKFLEGVISTSPAKGKTLYAPNYNCEWVAFDPLFDDAEFLKKIGDWIEGRNPRKERLYDKAVHGSKNWNSFKHYRVDPSQGMIFGNRRPIILPGSTPVMTSILLYHDGSAQIGPSGEILGPDDLGAMIAEKRIGAELPESGALIIEGAGLLSYRRGGRFMYSAEDQRIDLRDEVNIATGKGSAVSACLAAFKNYTSAPSNEAREAF